MPNQPLTSEQQIDVVIESLKAQYTSRTSDPEIRKKIIDSLDSLGHNAKAFSALVDDHNPIKATLHMILSRMK